MLIVYAGVVLVMFLKLKEFGGISFRPEESVSLSIVHVGPYLLSCIRTTCPAHHNFVFNCPTIYLYFASPLHEGTSTTYLNLLSAICSPYDVLQTTVM
jgi:hypothetical protein